MSKKIEDQYQKLTQLEHILKRPDTYIGSIKPVTDYIWVMNSETQKFEYKCIEYTPGLYQIVDEVIVNAIDHSVINEHVKVIKVNVDIKEGKISVWNDGDGIPVHMHAEHGIYIPELIFGHLLTSTNYDDTQSRIVGGRNGYGAKLTNIYSTFFEVETLDPKNKKKYIQTWKHNMSEKSEPIITSSGSLKKGYTKITFKPDFKRFGIKKSLSDDIFLLIQKRAYDAAACTRKDITVYFNEQKLNIKTFERYVDMYIGARSETKRVYESKEFHDGTVWEIATCLSDDNNHHNDGYMQVSFVNGICTEKGGKHVDNIVYQITNKLIKYIQEKIAKGKNKDISIKPNYIKDRLWVFLRATIVNPAFSSQTKDELTTAPKDFGYRMDVSDKFIETLAKSGIVNDVMNLARFKEEAKLARDTDGRKRNKVRIPNLDDANWAGTSKSSQCILILTEGMSAKTFAVSGLSIVGRDRYGVFPLRGKPLNVRDANPNQLANNQELASIKQIVGLQEGVDYTTIDKLRYGHILIIADADEDGHHIKGLLINMFHAKWSRLLKTKGFICSMETPIVKVSRNHMTIPFYNMYEYNEWKQQNRQGQGWRTKYYKGLGTSTAPEAREYFKELETNTVTYKWDSEADASIELAFDKKKSDRRKQWLGNYNAHDIIHFAEKEITYTDFVNRKLIHFSAYDLLRSIPSICDGLKPSQRKVLYTCIKENIMSDTKVIEISGTVMKNAAYHHGDMSLHGTIIGLAQDYMGSNNINLLYPQGQFGSRVLGGKDSASPRYISTYLNKWTRNLFNSADDALLEYLNDDGKPIEPRWYIPIIPMVLVNGSEGIGTGYSSYIPCYNPKDVINNLLALMQGNNQTEMKPWYKNFRGKIEKTEGVEGSFQVQGVYKRTGDKSIDITELPVGVWTTPYKEFLETLTSEAPSLSLLAKKEATTAIKTTKTKKLTSNIVPLIDHFLEYHTDTDVKFTVFFKSKDKLDKLLVNGELCKELKLIKSISIRNMHLWNSKGQIQKYESPNDIITEFFNVRLEYYTKRRDYLLSKYTNELKALDEKIRFIKDVISEHVKVFRQKKVNIIARLEELGYTTKVGGGEGGGSYDYLISMPLYQFTEEKIDELEKQRCNKAKELEDLESKTETDLWTDDIVSFIQVWNNNKKKIVI